MDDFKKIDWNNKIEDIIDDKFVDQERMQKESAIYKIVNGVFTDPFSDVRPPEFPKKPKKTPETANNDKTAPAPAETNLQKDVNKRVRTKSKQNKKGPQNT